MKNSYIERTKPLFITLQIILGCFVFMIIFGEPTIIRWDRVPYGIAFFAFVELIWFVGLVVSVKREKKK